MGARTCSEARAVCVQRRHDEGAPGKYPTAPPPDKLLSDAPRLQHPSLRDRASSVYPPSAVEGFVARPLHDPSWFVHDEAQWKHRDGPHHTAWLCEHAPPC